MCGPVNSSLGLVRDQDLYSTRTQWKGPTSFLGSRKFDFAQETKAVSLNSCQCYDIIGKELYYPYLANLVKIRY